MKNTFCFGFGGTFFLGHPVDLNHSVKMWYLAAISKRLAVQKLCIYSPIFKNAIFHHISQKHISSNELDYMHFRGLCDT